MQTSMQPGAPCRRALRLAAAAAPCCYRQVYLNDSFAGGATTFYTPSVGAVGVLDARGVTPRAGCVLVFPHGGARGSLVHEGSAVSAGAKHVIRTDVLYMKARGGRGGGGGDGSSGGKRQRL